MAKDPGGQLTEQPGPVTLGQFLDARPVSRVDAAKRQRAVPRGRGSGGAHMKDGKDALALCVADGAEAVPGDGAGHHAGDVCDDEAEGATADAAQQAPELVGRPVGAVLGHALLTHHLLEDVAELRILRLLPIWSGAAASLLGEVVPGPRVCALTGGRARVRRPRRLVVAGLAEGVRLGAAVGGAAKELTLGVVVAPAPGVGEGVVGVVDELEPARAGRALGGVGGHPVGMRLEGGAGEGQPMPRCGDGMPCRAIAMACCPKMLIS